MSRMSVLESPRERELRGHDTRRYELPMRTEPNEGPNPSGLCMCGCVERTPLAKVSSASRGHVRGLPIRFIHGHHGRGTVRSLEEKQRQSEAKLGARNPAWKGGRVDDSHGYWKVKVGRGHPMANRHGYVKEHRLVMAKALGRPLQPSECVHHIDLDRRNNALENLVLVSRSQHMAIHRRITAGQEPLAAMREVLT